MNEDLAQYLMYYETLVSFTRPAIVLLILAGLWFALKRTTVPRRDRMATWLAVAVPSVAWFASIWSFALAGAFEAGRNPIPLIPLAVFFPLVIGLTALTRSNRIAAALDAVSPGWLVGIQVYRVLGGNFLVLWSFGAIPGEFALPAGGGDVLVGLLALPAALVLTRSLRGPWVAVAWNCLGILDLLTALTFGALTTPGPLHRLALDHPNLVTSTYPTVMTPTFAVPLSLILHGLSLWQLRRRMSLTRGSQFENDVEHDGITAEGHALANSARPVR